MNHTINNIRPASVLIEVGKRKKPMEFFAQQLVNGIALGSVYALSAIGYSLVYAVLELINFTHGTMYMVGAYLFLIFVSMCSMPYYLSFILAVLLTGTLGYCIEKFTLRPIRKKKLPNFMMLICTMGVSILIQNIMLLFLGSQTRLYPTLFDGRNVAIFGANISYIQIFVVIMAIILMLLMTVFIKKSKAGMAMRATAQNSDAAELMGINVDRVVGLTFFAGAALATISGIFSCMIFRSINLSSGVVIGNKTFAATVLGGIGELKGAVLGGILIGIIETFTAGYISSNLRDIAAFIVLIIVLIVRPRGLLGKPVQKKV